MPSASDVYGRVWFYIKSQDDQHDSRRLPFQRFDRRPSTSGPTRGSTSSCVGTTTLHEYDCADPERLARARVPLRLRCDPVDRGLARRCPHHQPVGTAPGCHSDLDQRVPGRRHEHRSHLRHRLGRRRLRDEPPRPLTAPASHPPGDPEPSLAPVWASWDRVGRSPHGRQSRGPVQNRNQTGGLGTRQGPFRNRSERI